MKLVKTTTHLDTVVLTDREFDLLHEPDSQLTVIISRELDDGRYETIKRIEKVDLPYALTHIKRYGYGYYEGKKIVYIRPLNERKPRAKKQFCVGGHDTFAVGRNTSGVCNECAKLHNNVSNAKKRLETAQKKVARAITLQGLNPDVPTEL